MVRLFNNTGGALSREEEAISIQVAHAIGITGDLVAVCDNGFVLEYLPGKTFEWDSRHDENINR